MKGQTTFVVFKYYSNESGNFPAIPLFAFTSDKKIKFHALIDSGATISVFKDEIAETLGIKIETGKEIILGGVGGRIKGYIHQLDLEVADKRFRCPVVFSREYLVSFNLLGRDTFFEKFQILFSEKQNRIQLQ